MHADDFFGSLRSDGDVADREGGSVGSEDAVLGNVLFHLLDDLMLDVNVLEHGFNDHVRRFETVVLDCPRSVGSNGVRFELCQLLSFHCNEITGTH